MQLPQDFHASSSSQVCKLGKFLYGLNSRQRYSKLSNTLINQGFTQAASNPSLCIKKTPSSFTTLFIYVDDVILTGSDVIELNIIKNYLNTTFSITDMGNFHYFVSLEILITKSGIHQTQTSMLFKVLLMLVLWIKTCSLPINKNGSLICIIKYFPSKTPAYTHNWLAVYFT